MSTTAGSTDKSTEQICMLCHKPIAAGAKASLTNWIFKDYRCRCRNPQIAQAHEQKEGERPLAIPGFEIVGPVGAGGMGTLFKAKKPGSEAAFAIKILKQEFAKDKAARIRFEQEAELSKRLTHTNLVTVYECGVASSGAPYLVMDFVDGESLDRCLGRETSIEPRRAINIFVQLCDAMEYAHACGVLHRDLKPSNILLVETGEQEVLVKVVDFGIAKLLPRVSRETLNLTKTGEIFGSPFYMSPEQCMGEELDERSDIYSMGCVMYEVLTGSPPFKSDNPVKTIMQHVTTAPRPCGSIVVGHNVDSDLEDLVMQCLAKERSMRVDTMAILKHRLEGIASRMGEGKERMHASVSYLYRRRAILAWFFVCALLYALFTVMTGQNSALVMAALCCGAAIWYFRKMMNLKTIDRILKTQEPEQIEIELFLFAGSHCARFALPGDDGRNRARVLSVSFRGGKTPSEIKSLFNGERRTVLAYRNDESGEPVAMILGKYLCVVSNEAFALPLKPVEELPLLPEVRRW